MPDWVDDIFAGGHVAQTDMQAIENNFGLLKISFAGASAPTVNVADGMWWLDTGNRILKYRENGLWVNIYDFANSRVLASLDCSRSVLAGTGMSGGGVLSADRTISHGSSQVCTLDTIPADLITLANMQHGSIPLPFIDSEKGTELSTNSSSYVSVFTSRFYVPTDATVIYGYARMRGQSSVTVSCRLVISATGAAGSTSSTSYTWIPIGACDVSSVSGWQTLQIQLKVTNVAYTGYLQGYSFYWA